MSAKNESKERKGENVYILPPLSPRGKRKRHANPELQIPTTTTPAVPSDPGLPGLPPSCTSCQQHTPHQNGKRVIEELQARKCLLCGSVIPGKFWIGAKTVPLDRMVYCTPYLRDNKYIPETVTTWE